MSTMPFVNPPEMNGLIQISSKEEIIRQRLEEARRQLEKEAGIERQSPQHFRRPTEKPFTRSQRDHTTILFGGLTWKHEKLVHGALESLGTSVRPFRCRTRKPFNWVRNTATTGNATPPTSQSATLWNIFRTLRKKGILARKLLIVMCFSRLAPVVHAVSECTRRNIAWLCATPDLTASACCSSSRAAG